MQIQSMRSPFFHHVAVLVALLVYRIFGISEGSFFPCVKGFTRRTDHDLDRLDPNPPEMLCRICIVQIHPRKHVLDHSDDMAPTWQHELDHRDQESICLEKSRS